MTSAARARTERIAYFGTWALLVLLVLASRHYRLMPDEVRRGVQRDEFARTVLAFALLFCLLMLAMWTWHWLKRRLQDPAETSLLAALDRIRMDAALDRQESRTALMALRMMEQELSAKEATQTRRADDDAREGV